MKYIDQTEVVNIREYPEKIQEYLNKMESLDGVETAEYFDLSDGLESFLEPFLENRDIAKLDVMKMVVRYSYTLDQIERVKGIRLF